MKKYVILALALSGCAPGYYQSVAHNVYQQCDRYGFTPGTSGYSRCVMDIDQARMPLCSKLPPGSAGYAKAQGRCIP